MHKKLIFLIGLFLILTTVCANSPRIPTNILPDVRQVYEKYKNLSNGNVADYIPELAKVNPNLFAIAIVTVQGKVTEIGDVNVPFPMESISKPFVYALALQDNGEKFMDEKVGLNATGHAFNSTEAITEKANHLQNPLVNAGAIQVTSFIKGKDSADKWQRVLSFVHKLSNKNPYLGVAVYKSEMATNQHNQQITKLLTSYGMMGSDPMDALDRYTKACSIMVTAQELALMGATLANNGINPITHERVVKPKFVRDVLSEMAVNGLYENSGTWWTQVGIPAKSGVSGGIIAVIPGRMAIVVFSPPLDAAGNSVKAQAVIKDLSERWRLHLLEN